MPTFEFHTLGCKVNQYETEAMEELLGKAGYTAASPGEAADLYVINTCTVTHVSDAKSRQQIRRMKRKNPDAIVAVVGCYAQVAPEAMEAMEGVDIILGTKGRARLPELLEAFQRTGQKQCAVVDLDEVTEFDSLEIETEHSTTRAAVKIQEGCDMYCSYCIIPYARGHIASRPLESIVREVHHLASRGFREIVLTGIHVASYGKEATRRKTQSFSREPIRDLVEVVEAVAAVEGIERVRLSSIEPRWVTPEKLLRLRQTGKFCAHFHLSLQSGSDAILEKMNRKYGTALYRQKVQQIRDVFPQAGMTTDVIVGFPGETEENFRETLDFCKTIGFSRMHIFPYSPRHGTPAALFTGQVDPEVKKERAARCAELEESMRTHFMDHHIGSVLPVLLEARETDGRMEGYTENYLRVAVAYQPDLVNCVVPVQIERREGDRLIGHFLEGEKRF